MKKTCATCGEEKEIDEFPKRDNGYRSICKACVAGKKREEYHRSRNKAEIEWAEAVARDPFGILCASVIEKAILDWRRYSDLDVRHRNTTEYKELTAFFDSTWFEELCDACNTDAEYARKHILEEQDAWSTDVLGF